jgi:hypothetical protein
VGGLLLAGLLVGGVWYAERKVRQVGDAIGNVGGDVVSGVVGAGREAITSISGGVVEGVRMAGGGSIGPLLKPDFGNPFDTGQPMSTLDWVTPDFSNPFKKTKVTPNHTGPTAMPQAMTKAEIRAYQIRTGVYEN